MLSPQHLALNREAAIAAELLASGVTLLGRANYAHTGLYGQSFFNLSIGFERAAKLIYLADYAIENAGAFPSDDLLKGQIGHDLTKLFSHAESVSIRRQREDVRPSSPIHNGIIETLSEFAKETRYYNLAFVTGGKSAKKPDPMVAWNNRVTQPIIEKHCKPAQRMQIDENARVSDTLLSGVAHVEYTDEAGDRMTTVYAASLRTGETDVARKWAPLYVLQLIRWQALLIDDLSHQGAYKNRIEALLGLDEHFAIFVNDDRYFKSRRTWSIYGR